MSHSTNFKQAFLQVFQSTCTSKYICTPHTKGICNLFTIYYNYMYMYMYIYICTDLFLSQTLNVILVHSVFPWVIRISSLSPLGQQSSSTHLELSTWELNTIITYYLSKISHNKLICTVYMYTNMQVNATCNHPPVHTIFINLVVGL